MIVPVGKYKPQVNQGILQNRSIWNDELIKLALGNPSGSDDIAKPGDDLQQAMNEGGLGRDPGQPDPNADPQLGLAGQNPNSIAPAGGGIPAGGGTPADQFLGPAPMDESQQVGDPFEQERQKIRQFVGYQNFGVDLKPGSDGTLEVTLIPPQGQPVDVGGLLEGLQSSLGGQWKGETTPASTTGGPIKFKYVPQGMATPQKIEKAKGGRR